jgi:hypothetical protein
VVAAPSGTEAEDDDVDDEPAATPAAAVTTEMPAPVGAAPREAADGFPIEDYDRLRATELLAMLPSLDRNQLEAVRQRESSGKNRFTIMSRVDALLASKEQPAWEAADDDWESGVGDDAESEAVAIEAQAIRDEDGFGDELDEAEVDEDEVDELVSPSAAAGFPIAGYDSLTVGQILPRLSELDAGGLAEVRAREQQGRNRGTILDRVDRLSARAGAAPSGAMAMPPAAPAARKAPARKATARKAPVAGKAPAASKSTAPAVKKGRPSKVAAIPVPAAPAPAPAKATRKSPAKKAAVAPVVPATTAGRKSAARKAAPAPAPAPAPAKAGSSMKDAVKKARAAKKR